MTINSTTRKTNPLVGNGNAHTYPFSFKVFSDADVVVKKLEASTSIETTLQLGANNDYIVTLNQDQNGSPGGSITLKSGGNNQNLASGFSIVITSALDALQGTDLTNQGGFYPEVINDALDKSVILHQQQQDELDRSIKFSLTNTIGSLEITENANARKNKVLAFDNAGEFSIESELGTYRGNWAASTAYTVRDIVKDTSTNNVFLCNTAHTSSGAQPLTTNTHSANWDLLVDAATATTSSTNAASSATAAANSATAAANSATAAATSATSAASSATTATTKATAADTAKTAAETAKTAAETAQTAAEAALDSFDDRYLGAKSSDPTLDNDGNALLDGAIYWNTSSNVTKIYDLGNTSWDLLKLPSSDQTKVNTVAGISSNVTTVAGISSNVTAVAGNATNINAVAGNNSNITSVANNSSNINSAVSNASNITTVATNINNVNAIATDIAKIQTVANDLNETVSEIETAANDLNETTSEIDTVANAITNVDNVGNNIANVNTVAGISSNVTSVAGNAANVNLVAGSITNVNNVGGSIANVNTCATNLSGINSFAARYRTDNTGNNPSSNNDSGDLFFNQGSGKLLVYNGNTSAWEETQSVGNFFINTIGSYSGTGGNSATFNGSAYKFTLSNAGQFAQQMLVSVNGVVQKPNTGTGQPSEGFALDGANIVFSAAPPSGADYFIVTIGASVSIGTPSNNTVTSAHIVNGTIVNDDINASAAIALSKLATSGTANNTTFLRGDGAWTVVATDVVGDTSPQLGGTLDCNNQSVQFKSGGATKIQYAVGNNSLEFVDDAQARFGSGDDLKIYHNGTHSYLDNSTGSLFCLSDSISFNGAGGSETMAAFTKDGACELWYDNSKKIETNSTGVHVTGMVTCTTEFRCDDNEKFVAGTGQDLQIYHDGSGNNIIDSANNGTLKFQRGGSDVFEIKSTGLQGLDSKKVMLGTSDDLQLFHDGTHSYIEANNTGNLYVGTVHSANLILVSGNSGRWSLSTSGHLLPEVNNTYNIGSESYRVANVYTQDIHLSNEAKGGNDVDGTWGSYTIQEGAEDLFLINKRNGKKYKFNLTEVS